MPTCAQCRQPYHEDWDACPNCIPRADKTLWDIRSRLTFIALILTVGFALSILAALASCSDSLPG